MVAQPEGVGDPISFAFVVPDCDPGDRLSVHAPDGAKLMIPCPANVTPGMKLVMNKNEEGAWRIAHAKEAVVSPAKFSLPANAPNSSTPTRAPLEERHQPLCWAEPRQEKAPSNHVEGTFSSNGISKEDSNRNSTGALSQPAENERARNRPSSRLSGSRGARSASPTTNPSSSRDSNRGYGPPPKPRGGSPGLSGRNRSGLSPSGNRRSSANTPALENHSSRSITSREADKIKDLIRGVYQRKNPAKLAELETLLIKHKGDEKGIYEHVCRKYGETPRPWGSKP